MSHIATRIFNQPLMVNESKLAAMLPWLMPRLGISGMPDLDSAPELAAAASQVKKEARIRSYDVDVTDQIDDAEEAADAQVVEATTSRVRRLVVAGTLVDRYANAGSGAIGYDEITAAVNAAVNDPQVNAIVLDISSFGGEVAGVFECGRAILAARGAKPVWCSINHDAYSAACLLASACERVYCSENGGTGSIGCVAIHYDYSKAVDASGIVPTVFRAGKKKDMLSPLKPVEKDVAAWVQEGVERVFADFVAFVADVRRIDAKKIKATESAWLRPQEALDLGLIDGIGDFDFVMAELRKTLGKTKRGGGSAAQTMKKETVMASENMFTAEQLSAAETKAAAAAMTAERKRWQTALSNEDCAVNLAATVEMLASSEMGVEQVAAVAAKMPKLAATSGGGDEFAKRLAAVNPKVGPAGAQKEEAENTGAQVDRILGANKGGN
jgi:capsid assembly protease